MGMPNIAMLQCMVPRVFRSGSAFRSSITILRHLLFDYGWLQSVRQQRCIMNGNDVPWFTYPAIEFLKQIDFRDKSVFEWGAGYSTVFWASRAKEVVSIETESSWYRKIQDLVGQNVVLILSKPSVDAYVDHINKFAKFDIIVIDGTGESRVECCRKAIGKVNNGGMIILDNSDLWLNSASVLRSAGFIQVDFTGFSPMSAHCHTTSIFFTRDYNFEPLDGFQPHKGTGQPSVPWPCG
jgi:hypothetical protein